MSDKYEMASASVTILEVSDANNMGMICKVSGTFSSPGKNWQLQAKNIKNFVLDKGEKFPTEDQINDVINNGQDVTIENDQDWSAEGVDGAECNTENGVVVVFVWFDPENDNEPPKPSASAQHTPKGDASC